MIVLLSILIGFYIVADSIYLASKADGEDRYCVVAKYAGALMAGLCMMFKLHDEISLLFGSTIALFMWPETYYRVFQYVQIHHLDCCNHLPRFVMAFLVKLTPKFRRKGDYEAHY